MSSFGPPDAGLLDRAARMLHGRGFEVATEGLPGTDQAWLLAEDALCVIAIVAAEEIDDMRRLETYAVKELLSRLDAGSAGPKRWDAYLVLMSSRKPTDAHASTLQSISHNTHGVRRLTAVGTKSSDEAVEDALRPFLPLDAVTRGVISDAFAELETQLVLLGTDPSVARAAIESYKATGAVERDA